MRLLLCLGLSLAAACDRPPGPVAGQAGENTFTPDSIRREQLARFRQGLPEIQELSEGRKSREDLVQAYLQALTARDTAALRRLALTRGEFGWIYYPTDPQAHPPYDVAPELLWFMITEHSGKGLGKALERFAGKPIPYAGHSCDSTVSREGENTVYGPCVVRLVQGPGDTTQMRIFGPVVERHGQWKFVSYANKLD